MFQIKKDGIYCKYLKSCVFFTEKVDEEILLPPLLTNPTIKCIRNLNSLYFTLPPLSSIFQSWKVSIVQLNFVSCTCKYK